MGRPLKHKEQTKPLLIRVPISMHTDIKKMVATYIINKTKEDSSKAAPTIIDLTINQVKVNNKKRKGVSKPVANKPDAKSQHATNSVTTKPIEQPEIKISPAIVQPETVQAKGNAFVTTFEQELQAIKTNKKFAPLQKETMIRKLKEKYYREVDRELI